MSRRERSHWLALMQTLSAVLLILLAGGLAAPPTGAQTTAAVTFECRVIDEGDRPVAGARVVVEAQNGTVLVRGETDANGRFVWRHEGLPAGRYQVGAMLSGFSLAFQEFRVDVLRGILGMPQVRIEVAPARRGTSAEVVSTPDVPGKTVRVNLKLYKPVAMAKAPPPPAPPPPPPMAPPGENYAKVQVFYATDRRPTGQATPVNFYGSSRSQGGALSYGVCEVSIPREHQLGELEAPSIWKLEFREDPEKHVVLLRVRQQSTDEFFGGLSARVAQSGQKAAFVFVHGYNVTFEDAARRTAQLHYDLAFDGAPILYSWPSRGSVLRYTADEATAEWTAPHLKSFLEDVAARSGATIVHLVAHSMGNRPLTSALKAIATEQRATPMPRFRQVVLAAPDVDAGVFRELAGAIRQPAERVTLYASSNDKAIIASKQFHGFPRAGESGENIIVVPGIDTVDVSTVETGLLGHSYFGDTGTVMYDLFRLVREGAAPAQRAGLVAVTLGTLVYWALRP